MKDKNILTLKAIVEEFIADVDAVGKKVVAKEWPDLVVTYNNAKRALAQEVSE